MSVERRGPAICNASKAKAEPSWRFWGLYVHVCKVETLRAAYEAQGEALLEQLRDELTARTYKPLPARRQEIPKDGGKVRILSIPAIPGSRPKARGWRMGPY